VVVLSEVELLDVMCAGCSYYVLVLVLWCIRKSNSNAMFLLSNNHKGFLF
jgi:hypothetical protein